MAGKKKAAAKSAKAPKAKAAKPAPKVAAPPAEPTLMESTVSTTGPSPVYRADLGESLPPQK